MPVPEFTQITTVYTCKLILNRYNWYILLCKNLNQELTLNNKKTLVFIDGGNYQLYISAIWKISTISLSSIKTA